MLAAEPLAVVGVDVAAPFEDRPGKVPTMEDNLRVFKDQLTAKEMKEVMKHEPDEVKMEQQLRTYWSLKESYTKARGDGLGFEFNRCSFRYIGAALESSGGFGLSADRGSVGQPVALASVVVDGKANRSWRFYVQPLEDDHFISVARGSPKEIVDANGAFKASLSEPLSTSCETSE